MTNVVNLFSDPRIKEMDHFINVIKNTDFASLSAYEKCTLWNTLTHYCGTVTDLYLEQRGLKEKGH